MRDPFETRRRWKGWNRLMSFDSWVDDFMYRQKAQSSETLENLTIFFRRFRVYGWKKAGVELACEGLTLGVVGALLILALGKPAYDLVDTNWRARKEYSMTFLDRFGNEIGRRGQLHSAAVPVDQLPDHLIKAVLSTEDRRFFEHIGLDFWGLTRAVIENTKASGVVQGGSTITQQLAKNVFLTNERSLERKIKEAYLSLWLEWNLPKKEILKLYLDRAYMGGSAHGAAAAAQFYFDKSIRDVTLAEAAMLAGLFKAPSKYAPHRNLPAARARANEVLTNLVQANFMTEGQVVEARRNPATPVERKEEEKDSPDYFLDWAFGEAKKIAQGFPTNTLVVRTTVDPSLQKVADDAIISVLQQNEEAYEVEQGSMVVIEHGGAVRAIVGGKDYGESQYNRATMARRQPGSAFKPFVYVAAMMKGYTADSVVSGAGVCYRGWCPKNYAGKKFGKINLTRALVKSVNTVPVRLGLSFGRKPIVEVAQSMGITSPMQYGPAMVLGDERHDGDGARHRLRRLHGGGSRDRHLRHHLHHGRVGRAPLRPPARRTGTQARADGGRGEGDEHHHAPDPRMGHGAARQDRRAEDRRQDRHHAVLPRRLVRGLYRQLRHGRVVRERFLQADQQDDRRLAARHGVQPLHDLRPRRDRHPRHTLRGARARRPEEARTR